MKVPKTRGAVNVESTRRSHNVLWAATGSDAVPYKADVGDEMWLIRINDFPDEHLYTLIVDGEEAESFDHWPSAWLRPEQSAGSSEDIRLSELVRSLRALAADSPESQARIEQIARAYASGVYRLAEERTARLIKEVLGHS